MTVERRPLHPSGPLLSRVVWGAWRALESPETDSPSKLARVIERCLELGLTSFDHADIYGGYGVEALFGHALAEWRGDRSRIEIVTKCGIALRGAARPDHRVKHYDSSAGHIVRSVDASLKNLRTDYIDLLLLHRPDPLMDADDTARGFEAVIAAGKVRFVGVSNHTPAQIELLQSRLSVPLVTNQIEFSVLHTAPLHDGTLDQAQRLSARPMIWSPLGGGDLFRSSSERASRVRAALERAGERLGTGDLSQVALAWIMRHPAGPVPVIGTGQADRLRAAAAACDIAMDPQVWFEILEASEGREVP